MMKGVLQREIQLFQTVQRMFQEEALSEEEAQDMLADEVKKYVARENKSFYQAQRIQDIERSIHELAATAGVGYERVRDTLLAIIQQYDDELWKAYVYKEQQKSTSYLKGESWGYAQDKNNGERVQDVHMRVSVDTTALQAKLQEIEKKR